MIQTKFGSRVKTLRQNRNISQEKFALSIEMDRTYLTAVENGRRNLSLNNINKIAQGLNISLSELFEGIDEHED